MNPSLSALELPVAILGSRVDLFGGQVSQGYVIPMGPEDMARFACEDQALKALIEGAEPETDWTQDTRFQEVILPLLNQLPSREADLVELYFVQRKRQSDIAYVFGCTQAAVSYRIQRAAERLRFLVQAPKLTTDEILALLSPHMTRLELKILMVYRETTSQSDTAKKLRLTQGRVRHRIMVAVRRLEKLAREDPRFEQVAQLFVLLRDNTNILSEVFLPQFQKKLPKRDDLMGVMPKKKQKRK